MHTVARFALMGLLVTSLAACSGMSRRDRDTAVGAGIGAAGGAVLSNGSPLGTVGGALVGGVIGNQVGRHEDDDRNDRYRR